MKPFNTIAVVVFSLVALLQLLRAISGWEVTVNGRQWRTWTDAVCQSEGF